MNNTNEKFFIEAFEGFEVPSNLKQLSIEICTQFNIKGLSDPMHIVNVIASRLGVGDGMHNFNNSAPDKSKIDEIVKYLTYSYSTKNIDDETLIQILNKYL